MGEGRPRGSGPGWRFPGSLPEITDAGMAVGALAEGEGVGARVDDRPLALGTVGVEGELPDRRAVRLVGRFGPGALVGVAAVARIERFERPDEQVGARVVARGLHPGRRSRVGSTAGVVVVVAEVA